MSHVHFTEEQLQTLAIDRRNTSDCLHCQNQLRAYQLLYDHIAETDIVAWELDAIILAHLPDYQQAGSADNRFLYFVLAAALAFLAIGAVALWGAISWIFHDIKPLIIIGSVALLAGLFAIQLLELYRSYHKKLSALQPDLAAGVSS